MRRLPYLPAFTLAAAALALQARAQAPEPAPPDTRSQAVRDAQRDLWTPGVARALRNWLVKASGTPLPGEAALAPDGPDDGWSAHVAWSDVTEMRPPDGSPPDSRFVYAFTTLEREQAGPAELAIGSRMPVQAWVNGVPAGEVPGAQALVRDSVRLPVRLRAGENRILLRTEHSDGPPQLTARLLESGQPVAAPALAPWIDSDSGRLVVHAGAPTPAASVRIAVLAPGGRTVAEAPADRRGSAVFEAAAWPDGPYELRVTGADAFGAPAVAWLPWYKGDPAPAARNLLERAAAAGGDDSASGHWRMLGALLADRAGADLVALDRHPETVHAVLMEAAELDLGPQAAARPSGMVRLAWIDPVDGSTQFCRAHLPPDYDPARPSPTVIYLHGFNPPNPPYIRFWRVDQRHDEMADRWNIIWIEAHGRANAQYGGIGERDVLRCLDEAKRRLRVDEDRVYLTGESMGGSGTWLIGSRHPDLFAAIVPVFGGWDFRLQRRGAFSNPAADRPMERWLAEAHSSFAGAEQLIATPVFVHHGDADSTVDVLFSRHAVERLQRWGYDVRYREYPGLGHEELHWRDQAIEWMLRHRRAAAPRQVRIRATDLEGAGAWWVRIEGAERPLEMIEAEAEMVEPGRLRLDTRNVASLVLAPPPALAGPGPLQVVWNGRPVEAALDGSGRARLSLPDRRRRPQVKRAGLEGGLSNVFATPFVIVAGTTARDPEIRRLTRDMADRLAEQWRLWQHVVPRIVADRDLTPEMERSFSLVLIGGPDANAVSRRLWNRLPVRVSPDSVTIDGRSFAARDALLDLVYPSPVADDRYVMLVAGTSAAGLRLWDPASYWHPVAGIRINSYDWTLRDAVSPALEPGLLPERGWIASGVFDRSWRRDDRWTFPGDPLLRSAARTEQ
ncbi:prolyl oligopeptidase family serine peptidase [Sphingosinicella sp. CPCC 101087]|uniref:prolyl oligopeptidase family serine peptidase n=1 Tax=Sphingosinicella sp. CPCC 101087 TaxID=2497754 RepID=UPI00101E006D|nr:prolyl oligopeptidase family serine peptidase [Sphingosinicella sp. CPCC 101087]